MTSPPKSSEDPKKFYGYLFKPDKGPTDIMSELLTGIGLYIQKNIGEPEVRELTPSKLAKFYKAVGGNYDPVFIEPQHDRIRFIYTSLGCQYTLQPGENDYEPPKIPTLTLKGFVRWQSIETLLGPEEDVPYLQYAIQHFEIMRYDGTTRFPQQLPKECLPTKVDDQVMKWHEDCSKRWCKEYMNPITRPRSPWPDPERWPARVSGTRASGDGARWEGRLDAGTVGGFGRLPPRRRISTDDMKGREKYHDGGGIRPEYEHRFMVERFGRILAPVELQRAAAEGRGKKMQNDGIEQVGERRRSRHRHSHSRETDHERWTSRRAGYFEPGAVEREEVDVGGEWRKRGEELAVVNKAREELQRLEQEVLTRRMRNDDMDPEDARGFHAFILHQESQPDFDDSRMIGLSANSAIEKAKESRQEIKSEDGNAEHDAESAEDETDMSKRVAWLGW